MLALLKLERIIKISDFGLNIPGIKGAQEFISESNVDVAKVEEGLMEQFLLLSFDEFDEKLDLSPWYCSRSKIYFQIRDIYLLIAAINKSSNDREFELYTQNALWNKVSFNRKVSLINVSQVTTKKVPFVYFKYLLWGIKQGSKKRRFKKQKYQALIFDRIKDNRPVGTKFQNVYMGEFIERFGAKYGILSEIGIPKKSDKTFSTKKEGAKADIFIDYYIVKSFLSKNCRNRVKEQKSSALKIINRTINSSKNELKSLVLHHLLKEMGAYSAYLFKLYAFERMFSKIRISKVLLIDEQGSQSWSLRRAAKEKKIKVFAVQHGAIHHLNPAYRYGNLDHLENYPVEYFFTWGEKSKKVLESFFVFPSEKIVIAGQQRTDALHSLGYLNKKTEKRLFVVATQPISNIALKESFFYNTMDAVEAYNKELEVIVKAHPGEKEVGFMKERIQELNTKGFHVTFEQKGDLFELLSETKVLITPYSTVGIEALYFGVDVMVYDPNHQDLIKMLENKVAKKCVDTSDILEGLKESDQNVFPVEKSQIDVFIEHSVFRIDGKVSERIFNHISK